MPVFAAILLQTMVTAPPAPPLYVPSSRTEKIATPRTRMSVTLRGGGALLWSGDLWVAKGDISSFRQTVQEPLPAACTVRRFGRGTSNQLSITISPGSDSERPGPADSAAALRVAVNVEWERPDGSECGGTRTVALQQMVSIEGSAPIELRGDGGLVVELRRR